MILFLYGRKSILLELLEVILVATLLKTTRLLLLKISDIRK